MTNAVQLLNEMAADQDQAARAAHVEECRQLEKAERAEWAARQQALRDQPRRRGRERD